MQHVIANATNNVPEAVAAQLPHISYLKRTARRVRAIVNVIPNAPATLEDLVFTPEFCLLRSTEADSPVFLKRVVDFVCEERGSNEKIIIFTTTDNLNLLAQGTQVFSDGTFKKRPQLFYQVYMLHGKAFGIIIPLVYVLMTRKTNQAYVLLLQSIKDIQVNKLLSQKSGCPFFKFQVAMSI
jgi:hypothetical protein